MTRTGLPPIPGLRQAIEADRQAVVEYVSGEPECNLFILGDVESYGLEGPHCQVFLREATGGGIAWLVLVYMGDYVFYSRDPGFDTGEVASFLRTQDFRVLSGKYDLVRRMEPCFPAAALTHTYLARLDRVRPLPPRPEAQNAQDPTRGLGFYALTAHEAELIIDLYCQIDQWAPDYRDRREAAVANRREGFLHGDRAYGFLEGNRLVAVASSTGANSRSAMIVGVGTHPDYRGRGLASLAVSRLCQDLLGEGKEFLCLFYNNPAAGRIYHRLGFVEVGAYGMLKLPPEPDEPKNGLFAT